MLPSKAKIEDFSHYRPIMVAISMTITFCLLWLLIAFILYRITRIASPTHIV